MTDIWGQAIEDYYKGEQQAVIDTETQYTETDPMPVGHLFRKFSQMPDLEQAALDRCTGRVLDVGCGAGSHALHLQQQGLEVVGLDRSKGALTVAKARGVLELVEAVLLDYTAEPFDTILLLMNGTGIFETVDRVPTYLEHLKKLLKPGGQVLIDSSDLQYLFDRNPDGSIWVPADRYYGELDFTITYKDYPAQTFPWLYLDPRLFRELCEGSGWTFELLEEGANFDYLARLSYDPPNNPL